MLFQASVLSMCFFSFLGLFESAHKIVIIPSGRVSCWNEHGFYNVKGFHNKTGYIVWSNSNQIMVRDIVMYEMDIVL